MKTYLTIAAAALLAGCNTPLGAKLGDQTFYHHPHCAEPFIAFVGESVIESRSYDRFGPERWPQQTQISAGHRHYYCTKSARADFSKLPASERRRIARMIVAKGGYDDVELMP